MKKILLGLTLLFTTTLAASAQDWQTDITKAKELSLNGNKPIILVFQGSDWCAPCIKLDREIWSSEEFKAYSKEHFVMLKADFPKRKKNALPEAQVAKNAQLAETYNKQGLFPFVVILNSDGKVLGNAGYENKSPEEYIALLESFSK